MFRNKKKKNPQFEQFKNFHLQVKLDCKGKDDTLFYEFNKPLDSSILEYLKPFGEIIPLSGDIYELKRDNFFKIQIPIGRTSIIAEIPENHDPLARIMLTNQFKLAMNELKLPGNIESICPEKAIKEAKGKMIINRTKCNYCLECVIKED